MCFRLLGGLAKGLPVYSRGFGEGERLNSPILVGSLKPERAALFFDERIHGWDGQQNPPTPAKARPLGALKQLICPKCGGRLFDCWAAFEHSDEDDDELDIPGYRERPEDFFSWFWLVTRCVSCRWKKTVADIECA